MSFSDFAFEVIEPDPFHRPDTNVFFRITNKMLPPVPPNHVVLKYGDLKRLFRGWHYLFGIPMLIMFFGLTALEDAIWHGFTYSPLSIGILGVTWLWHAIGWKAVALLVPAYLGTKVWSRQHRQRRLRRTKHAVRINSVGILNSMAVLEEQWFREGAENWTARQRFMSCVGFGFAHMANLFYPLSAILPLSLGGYLFMRVYLYEFKKSGNRKDAILAASLVHRVYNRVAILSAFVSLAYILLASTLHLPHLGF